MKLAQRYLAANFILPLVACVVFFASFLLTFQLFRIMNLLVSSDADVFKVLSLLGFIFVSFLPMAIPISLLFSSIFVLNRLSEDSEIVALRSFGFSKFELFKPFFAVSLLTAIVLFVLNYSLIPYSQLVFKNTTIELGAKSVLSKLKPGTFFTRIPGIVLFAEQVDGNRENLEEVFLNIKKDGMEQTLVAKKGQFINRMINDRKVTFLKLWDGNTIKKDSTGIVKVSFDEHEFPVIGNQRKKSYVNRAHMMPIPVLMDVVAKEKAKKKVSHSTLGKAAMELWSRFNTPVLCLAFTLIGFSLGVKRGRGDQKNSGVRSLLVLIGYYVIYFGLFSMVKKGQIPAVIATFIPTMILFFVGYRFYRKLDWN